MTQEEKQILLKDLCARLPYGVKVDIPSDYPFNPSILEGIRYDGEIIVDKIRAYDFGYYKPYLRPLSSMTEKEYGQYMEFIEWSHNDYDGTTTTCINKERLHEYLDFIYSHHLDDNNFIEKGLALEAKEEMYKI